MHYAPHQATLVPFPRCSHTPRLAAGAAGHTGGLAAGRGSPSSGRKGAAGWGGAERVLREAFRASQPTVPGLALVAFRDAEADLTTRLAPAEHIRFSRRASG